MARFVEVLQQVMETHVLTVKALANRSGFAEKSIYKYLSEVRTLPSDVLRAAFKITADLRLVLLIVGSVPVRIEHLGTTTKDSSRNASPSRTPIRIPQLKDVLPGLLTCMQETSQCARLVHDILADGQIDNQDLGLIVKFQSHIAEARKLLAVCDSAVESARERIAQ